MKNTSIIWTLTIGILVVVGLFTPTEVFAHCDGLDGPVVKAAQNALESGNVNLVLIWVQKEDEAEIKKAFEKILSVRKLSPEARELADMYFFETLVRIHRAGEGAPYTGLKPAGRDLGPAIPAVDKAVVDGAVEPLLNLVTGAVKHGILNKFRQTITKKKFDENEVEAGREYVKSYVVFMHYVKRIYDAASGKVEGHFPETTSVGRHEE